MDVAILGISIPIIALMIPIVAILASHHRAILKQREREAARKMYERIVREKLDVMKTAITMGYQTNDLVDLDSRLEKLIGSEQLRSILSDTPAVPMANAELMDSDLLSETQKVRRSQRQSQ
jgi:hypothetical protein